MSGFIFRDDDGILTADIQSRAPNTRLQQINELLGLSEVICASTDELISQDPQTPTTFVSSRTHTLPAGTTIPAMLGNPEVTVPFDVPVAVQWIAEGHLSAGRFVGTYKSITRYPTMSVNMSGRFELGLVPHFGI